uniref:Uncharacterized protein n=1 Tax=Aegilops tauschii subsp. strangulata TaxID=200361 RepID=A0A453MRZ2_AEGTS
TRTCTHLASSAVKIRPSRAVPPIPLPSLVSFFSSADLFLCQWRPETLARCHAPTRSCRTMRRPVARAQAELGHCAPRFS